MTEQQPNNNEESLLSKSTKIAERMEEANKRAEEILERQEKLMAENILGGRSDAGQKPTPPKEETPQEYKDKVMRGEL